VKKWFGKTRRGIPALLLTVCLQTASGQAVPYARSYAKPKNEVEQALKELQAYSGQKLPTLEGFVAPPAKPLERYERGFYQFTMELLPGEEGATIVRLSAKVTAWYADRDVTKSSYEVLVSNGRLELDLLDRLQEKLTGKPVDPPATANSNVQTPRPKLDLSGVPGASVPPAPAPAAAKTPDEVAALRTQRVIAEKRIQQLEQELQSLQEVKHNQAHQQNLVIVSKVSTPVYAKAADGSRILFQAAVNDEFEFLDMEGEWVHVSISGDSRGYLRQSAVQLPESVAARLHATSTGPETKFAGFRIEREEMSSFPGDWSGLKGKTVKIYTVQPLTENPKETGASARLNYALVLFEKGWKESAAGPPVPDGVVVIFDAADGGIAGASLADIQKLASGALSREAFWTQSYLDPPEAFHAATK
jgi:hypothetical protein